MYSPYVELQPGDAVVVHDLGCKGWHGAKGIVVRQVMGWVTIELSTGERVAFDRYHLEPAGVA